ncbi:MAG: TIGR00725 family protein [Methylocystaceae bacterium]
MMRIGVIGQSGSIPDVMYELAEELGREIAGQGAILFTGGTSGVMEAASKGAKSAGGLVVGILPGDSPKAGNPYIDIPVTTGMAGDYRSLILVHTCDGLIMVGGGNGTLGELSIACLNHKPVVIIESSGGWAERIRMITFDGCYLDHRHDNRLEYADNACQAVKQLLTCISADEMVRDDDEYDAQRVD